MNTQPVTSLRPRRLDALGPAVLCVALAFCLRASASVIDTYPDWDGNVTQSYLKVAQSFVAPADNILTSWQFTLGSTGPRTNMLFSIVRWDAQSGPIGLPLLTRQVPWPGGTTDVLVNNLNLTLAPGTRYAAVIDLNGYTGPSVCFEKNQNSYNQGNAAWYSIYSTWAFLNSTDNMEFRAEFASVPEPGNLLGLGLFGLALLPYARRPARR